jgi:hypothetical protein
MKGWTNIPHWQANPSSAESGDPSSPEAMVARRTYARPVAICTGTVNQIHDTYKGKACAMATQSNTGGRQSAHIGQSAQIGGFATGRTHWTGLWLAFAGAALALPMASHAQSVAPIASSQDLGPQFVQAQSANTPSPNARLQVAPPAAIDPAIIPAPPVSSPPAGPPETVPQDQAPGASQPEPSSMGPSAPAPTSPAPVSPETPVPPASSAPPQTGPSAPAEQPADVAPPEPPPSSDAAVETPDGVAPSGPVARLEPSDIVLRESAVATSTVFVWPDFVTRTGGVADGRLRCRRWTVQQPGRDGRFDEWDALTCVDAAGNRLVLQAEGPRFRTEHSRPPGTANPASQTSPGPAARPRPARRP